MFRHLPALGIGEQARAGRAAQLLAGSPERDLDLLVVGVLGPGEPRLVLLGQRGCVRQDDERGLQALGAVHGHDPHDATGSFRLALDLRGGAPHPVQEALQGGRVLARVAECQAEQFVHRLGGFRAEPGEEPGPGAERAEGLGEDRMRGGVIDAGEQGLDEPRRTPPIPPLAGPAPERVPQRAGAAGGERHQAVVVESAERAREHAGEGEIVLRQQQHLAERQQVLHGRLLGQHHAVEPCHRNAARLERTGKGALKGLAPPHEHQHVPGCQRAAPAFQHRAAVGLPRDPGCKRIGKTLRRAAAVEVLARDGPGLELAARPRPGPAARARRGPPGRRGWRGDGASRRAARRPPRRSGRGTRRRPARARARSSGRRRRAARPATPRPPPRRGGDDGRAIPRRPSGSAPWKE